MKRFSWRSALRKSLTNPGLAFRVARALLRGHYYRLKFKLTGQKVVIGRRFRAEGKLVIRGPGTVIFGDDCGVRSSLVSPTTPFTHAPEAVIRFGDQVLLTGCRLGCRNRIEVGDGAGIAEATLLDTDYHNVEAVDELRYNTADVKARPIHIGSNAWVGFGSIILKGVEIGENSVVGAGAVVTRKVPANSVVFGNPARVIWRLRGGARGRDGGGVPEDSDTEATEVVATTGRSD